MASFAFSFASAPLLPLRVHHLSSISSITRPTHNSILVRPSVHPLHFRYRRTPCMRVAADGDSVSVHYSGYLDDGTKFDSSLLTNEPLNFVIGAGSVIRGFDDAVRGLQPGEKRRTRIEPINAYGERTDELIFSLPLQSVPSGMEVSPDAVVPLSNGMRARVIEVTDTEVRLDANHELAGKALTFDMELVQFVELELQPVASGLRRAVFSMGCFWGAELAFQRVEGVISTCVGYTQGKLVNPTYQQVVSDTTGHAEAVAADYDPSKVSYEELVQLFWNRLGKSALTLNQVGNDVGTHYRSGIYYLDDEQKDIALKSLKKANAKFGCETVVQVKSEEGIPFYIAESYHQKYLEKGGQDASKNATDPIRCYG